MAHFKDGAKYTYGDARRLGPGSYVCAGWLKTWRRFPKGASPPGFLDRLAWRAVHQRDRGTRGFHCCDLCSGERLPTSIVQAGRKHLLGSAEITVAAAERTYAAPTLIVHYVASHGYLPPGDFVDAVLAQPEDSSLSDWSFFRGDYWD